MFGRDCAFATPRLESLERRDVPTASTVAVSLANGVLTIQGTDHADVVSVSKSGTQLSVAVTSDGPNAVYNFALKDVSQIQFFGGDGNDIFNNSTSINTYADGGAGDDSVYTGAGDDTLIGGDGNDVLSGGAGNDVLDGGAGNDALIGGHGQNTLTGGTGADVFYLDHGRDTYTDFDFTQGDVTLKL